MSTTVYCQDTGSRLDIDDVYCCAHCGDYFERYLPGAVRSVTTTGLPTFETRCARCIDEDEVNWFTGLDTTLAQQGIAPVLASITEYTLALALKQSTHADYYKLREVETLLLQAVALLTGEK